MLGAKTLFSLSVAATAVLTSSVHADGGLCGTNPAFDVAVQNLENMEQFKATVTKLALRYGIPVEESTTTRDVVDMADNAAANDHRIITDVLSNPESVTRASLCTLTANASDTKKLKMACPSNKIRFAAIVNWDETKTNAGLTAVRDGLLAEAGKIDFVLSAGDNFYSKGVSSTSDSQWTWAFAVYAKTLDSSLSWWRMCKSRRNPRHVF